MPKLTVQIGLDSKTVEVPSDKRLILALTDDAGTDQLHACGGHARCTTCRVEFVSTEPQRMTEAERAVLSQRGLLMTPNLRLSCQLKCDRDMTVKVISRLAGSGRADAGKRPDDQITPPPVWTVR
jgi:ferredoxin